jgi:hypothetical protein
MLKSGDNLVKWKNIISGSLSGKEKSDIDFDRENMIKCLCSQCPVQRNSECAQNKMKMLQISMKGMSPEPSDFPGMYCANGKAVCDDLDVHKKCQCINCEVWKKYELNSKKPDLNFCQNGKAE